MLCDLRRGSTCVSLGGAVLVCFVMLIGISAPRAEAQDDARLRRAEAAFVRGRDAFESGDYTGAREGFQAAYDLTENPAIRYNLGLVEERVGNLEEAAAHYRAYLRTRLPPEEAERTRERLEAVEALLGDAAPDEPTEDAPATVEPPAVAPTPRILRNDIDPIPLAVLTGGLLVSAVLGGTAAGFWVAANDNYTLLQSCAPRCTDAEIAETGIQGQLDATNGLLVSSIIVGAAAVAVSVVLFAIAPSDSESVSLRLGPGQLALAGTFR